MAYEHEFNLSQSHDVSSKWQSTFRRILAQVRFIIVATTVKNMLLIEWGLQSAFPSIVIPALTNIRNEHNANETLHLTPVQSSWLGSIGFILQPIGCLLSAFITDPLGRRRVMLMVNIPYLIGWFMMYNASSVTEIFVANLLLGLGIGLQESATVTYIGEICEPSLRSLMLAYASLVSTLGSLIIFTLNTLMPWRTVALCCAFLPILTIVALFFVPETPMWLLSKGRIDDAEKALQWLRGWAPKSTVALEFQELQRYSKRSKSCADCIAQNVTCSHPSPTIYEKIRELKQSDTMKPFIIVISLFVIAAFSGVTAMNPFIVQIMKAYDSPIAPDQTATIVSVASNLGIVGFLTLIRFTGKRPLYLTTMSVVFLLVAIVCAYGFIWLPSGYNSFDQTKFISMDNKLLPFIPFVCVILWNGFSYCGIIALPWQLESEVYPYKTRAMASGITSALSYVITFIATKSYYELEMALSLPGITLFNCVIIVIGFILMYKILPETEERTLEEIELHFSDKSKNILDHKISKITSYGDCNAE